MQRVLSKRAWRRIYRRLAPYYDTALRGFYLVGLRHRRYRRRAVEGLALQPGDTVVDLGCGTGVNFSLLQKKIGPAGRLIGVDLSGAMLGQARKRIQQAGWQNVELVEADMAEYAFPPEVDGILSTLAMATAPEYDEIIRRGAEALQPGGRMALFGLKRPDGWPEGLVRLGLWLNKPFGARLEQLKRHPWESLRRHLREISFEEPYFGAAYISLGEATGR